MTIIVVTVAAVVVNVVVVVIIIIIMSCCVASEADRSSNATPAFHCQNLLFDPAGFP